MPPAMPDGTEDVLLAEVTRGPLVESRHYGRAVVVDGHGHVLETIGSQEAPILPRSAIKPLQALPTIALARERGVALTDGEIAVMCASHAAEPFHLAAVRALLARAGASEADLHCGPHMPGHAETARQLLCAGQSPLPIHNNCSGKHAGMLLMAHLLGAPLAGYWEEGHPVQRRIQDVLLRLGGIAGPLEWGIDGCGVPTYAMPLVAMARAFARLAHPSDLPPAEAAAADAIRAAMFACPEYVSSTGSFHALLLRAGGGRFVSKSGAEGCHAIGVTDPPLGIAIKIGDGDARAMAPILLALLARHGALPADPELERWRSVPVPNTRGAIVGSIRAVV